MTNDVRTQQQLTSLLGGWDVHAEFAKQAEFAREAFQSIIGYEQTSTSVGKYQATHHAHLRKVYLEAREKYPEFADTLAWLMWWKIVDFDRLELLTRIEDADKEETPAVG
jgi:hypothetical protein